MDEKDLQEMLRQQDTATGPTFRFPQGLLNEADDGELQLAIAADPAKGVVRVDFGTPVKWLAIDKATARQIGQALLDKSDLLP